MLPQPMRSERAAARSLRYSERVDGTSQANTVVGLLGLSDTAGFGDLMYPRVTEQELAARLPHVEFRQLAPFGWEHPLTTNGGTVVEPLGEPTAARRAEIADQFDALVIGGGELIHDRHHLFAERYELPPQRFGSPQEAVAARSMGRWFIEGVGRENEARCLTLWNAVGVPFALVGGTETSVRQSLADRAYVSVRDERSLQRIRATGCEVPVAVIPDPGFLVPRLLPTHVLQRRRALHHLLSWLPVAGYVLVQGSSSMVPQVGQICAVLDAVLGQSDLAVVVLDSSSPRGDSSFGETLRQRCPVSVHVMPAGLVCEDIAAVIEGAKAIIAVSLHAGVTGMAFQVPTVIVNLNDQSKLTALAELTGPTCELVTDLSQLPAALRKSLAAPTDGHLVRSLQAELDTHFDRMATVIERAGAVRAVSAECVQRRAAVVAQELRALRRAHTVRGRQLVAERSAFAAALESQLDAVDLLQSRLHSADQALGVLAPQLAEARHCHQLAVHREEELDESMRATEAERDHLATRVALLVSVLEVHVATGQQHMGELQQQLRLTETALADVHRTKTFRLARLPRRAFGWLRR